MKGRMKKLVALGLSTMMLSSMAIGVQAADVNKINERANGSTTVEASKDIDVDGYVTKEGIIDTSGNPTNPSLPTMDDASNSNTPVDENSSNTSWGDDSTADSTQLILTAPATLAFTVAGNGDAANIQLKDSNDRVVSGTIYNQSCYIKQNLDVVAKKVNVQASKTEKAEGQFGLIADNANLEVPAGMQAGVQGIYLNLGENVADAHLQFATLGNTATNLGQLPSGTLAYTTDGEKAVNPSATKIWFSDINGEATKVSTVFSDEYDDGTELNTSYSLMLKYSISAE